MYGEFAAVDNIDFYIEEGECFGFLGPNGAGKTTTVKMIQCFSPISTGNLKVLGMDVRHEERKIKAHLGVVPQEDNLDLELTVLQNLVIYASYFGLTGSEAKGRAGELLDFFGLQEKRNTPASHLSGGMKRRLTIARALINDPALLILDEPTTGLDPRARHLVWYRLGELKKKNITLLLTTHYLEEAHRLCDRLLVMSEGKILDWGNPKDLVKKHVGDEVLELNIPQEQIKPLLAETAGYVQGSLNLGTSLYLFPRDSKMLMTALQNTPFDVQYQLLRPANLEDVFFKLTGRGLEE
jgi:lipooligosaccharide transport system ATP-binding protein